MKDVEDSEGKPQHIIRKELKARRKNDENDMNDMNKTSKLKLKNKGQSFKVPQINSQNVPVVPQENLKKQHSERVGDWVCASCNNLNFSFRKICNRCKIGRDASEQYAAMHMYNVSDCGPMMNFSFQGMPQGVYYNHVVTPSQPYSGSMPMGPGDASWNNPHHGS
jgi:hypothetical protein